MRAPFAVAEQRRRPLPRGKRGERAVDVDAQVRIGRRRRPLDLGARLAPPPAAAQELAPGDAQQPSLIAALAAPGRSRPPGLEEGLLRQILCALPARQA